MTSRTRNQARGLAEPNDVLHAEKGALAGGHAVECDSLSWSASH